MPAAVAIVMQHWSLLVGGALGAGRKVDISVKCKIAFVQLWFYWAENTNSRVNQVIASAAVYHIDLKCCFSIVSLRLILFDAVWDTLRQLETTWDTLRHSETHWDTLRHIETHWDTLRHIETHWDTLKHCCWRKASSWVMRQLLDLDFSLLDISNYKKIWSHKLYASGGSDCDAALIHVGGGCVGSRKGGRY